MENVWTLKKKLYHMPTNLDEEERLVEFEWIKGNQIDTLIEFWLHVRAEGYISDQEYRAIARVIEYQAARPDLEQDIF